MSPTSAMPTDSGIESVPSTFGPRAVLAAGLVGIAIGVVITLAFAPLIPRSHRHTGVNTPSPIPLYYRQALERRVHNFVDVALGYSAATGQHRLISVALTPDFATITHSRFLYDTTVTFLVNPNPLCSVDTCSIRSDAFAILRAIYGHALPVANIRMVGMFRFTDSQIPTIVMRAHAPLRINTRFGPWQSISRTAEAAVWDSVQHWISPRFKKYRSTPS